MNQTPDGRWSEFRSLVPATRKWAYLDNAAVAPLSSAARDAIRRWSTAACDEGDTAWSDWAQGVETVRKLAATLIQAAPEEIAFVANTTAGITLVAEGLPWQVGDNVVVLGNEFPSNLYPWMNLAARGVECRRIAAPGVAMEVDRILAACDQRTRLISASWVGYASGWRLDIDALAQAAHRRGILVLVDAIQALGVFPLNVHKTPIDFLAADGHKWLMGPEGAGLFYIRREHLERLRPLGVGWNSVVHAHDFARIDLNLRPTAARYEGGSQNMCGVLALGASLKMLAQFGLGPDQSPLAQRVLEITDLACDRLASLGAVIHSQRTENERSGIVAFDLPGRDLQHEKRRCLEAGIVLSLRNGWLRISPHAYANDQDIARLAEVLQQPG
jgi:selenocysteine lyase/cysteine desulfurase